MAEGTIQHADRTDGIVAEISDFFVASRGVEPPDVDLDIFEMGYVDSLFALQLVTFVEQRFQFEVTADDLDLDNFRTVSRLADFVRAKRAGSRTA